MIKASMKASFFLVSLLYSPVLILYTINPENETNDTMFFLVIGIAILILLLEITAFYLLIPNRIKRKKKV